MEAEALKQTAEDYEKKATEAVEDLIVSTLKEPYEGRFNEAKRLCEVAQSLLKARARRAGDFKEVVTAEQVAHYQAAVANGIQYTNANIVTNTAATTAVVINPVTWTLTTAV